MPAPRHMPARLHRRTVLTGALGGAALLALPSHRAEAATPAGDPTSAIAARLDQVRISRGMPALPIDHRLSRVSQSWSAQMAGGVGMAHNPDHVGQYGWPTEQAGEVVAYARDPRADVDGLAAMIVDGWMASAGHRAIILGDRWTDMGVGCAWAADGRLYATANVIRTALPAAAAEALALSTEVVGAASAPRIAIARCDVAADALAATVLLGPQSPLLLVRPGQPLPAQIIAEISRAATPQTRVYLVGGGLSAAVGDQVRATGAIPVPMAGASRYDTAVAIATEAAQVRQQPERIHLVRADAWADAVAVGGHAARSGAPVLLVDHDVVPDVTRQFLQAHPGAERCIVGGSGVIGGAVHDVVGGRRMGGADRAGTGVAVMQQLWDRTRAHTGDAFVVTSGWTGDGWATALAHTTWAAAHGAPLLLSAGSAPVVVRNALQQAGYARQASGISRFARHVSRPAQDEFRALIGG